MDTLSLTPNELASERSAGPQLQLYSLDDLRDLLKVRPKHRTCVVQASLPGLRPDEVQTLSVRLTKLVNACGCGIGAAASIAAISAILTWQSVDPPDGAFDFLVRIVASLAMVLGAGGLGKLLGVTHARRTLAREIALISRRLNKSN